MVCRVHGFLYFRKGGWRRQEGDRYSYGGNPFCMMGRIPERNVHPDTERNGVEEGGLSDGCTLGIATGRTKVPSWKRVCKI
jgi:hypothetical protein